MYIEYTNLDKLFKRKILHYFFNLSFKIPANIIISKVIFVIAIVIQILGQFWLGIIILLLASLLSDWIFMNKMYNFSNKKLETINNSLEKVIFCDDYFLVDNEKYEYSKLMYYYLFSNTICIMYPGNIALLEGKDSEQLKILLSNKIDKKEQKRKLLEVAKKLK